MLQDEHFFDNLHGKFFLILLLMALSSSVHTQVACSNLRDPACQCKIIPPYNLLRNPSFESYTHCPTPVHDYNSNYDIINFWRPGTHTSGVEIYHNDKCPDDSARLNFGYVIKRPLPDGAAFISILQSNSDTGSEKNLNKDYITQCLQTPLKKNGSYSFIFYAGFPLRRYQEIGLVATVPANPFKVAVFGHTDCSAIPFGTPYKGNGCPLNAAGWVLLGETAIAGDSSAWSQGKINLTIPFDINVIAIGPDCSKPPLYYNDRNQLVSPRFNYMDNFSLVETRDLNLQYISILQGNSCTGNLLLKAPTKPGSAYQWYKDSIALTGATDSIYVVPVTGNGNYNVRITNSATTNCIISESLPVLISELSALQWVTDTIVCSNQETIIAPVIPGILYSWSGGVRDSSVRVNRPGVYNITANDSNGCSKNFVIQVRTKICSNCDVLLPNAFSPNGDGINDIFKSQGTCNADEYNLQIFARSGALIFETKDINNGWDGSFNGKQVPVGPYYYLVRYKNIISQSDFIYKSGVVILFR